MAESTATSRPSEPIPVLPRLGLLLAALLAALEFSYRLSAGSLRALVGPLFYGYLAPWIARYAAARAWIGDNPRLAAVGAVAFLVAVLFVARLLIILWFNEVKARLSGTYFHAEVQTFPLKKFKLLKQLAQRPKGTTFVGLRPAGGRLFWRRWEPVYCSDTQRSTHLQVLGKTGAGKTKSVIWPFVLQDALAGHGVLVIDAKGSDENIDAMRAIAAIAGRQAQLRVFALPAWNQPHIFSHTYNMVYVRPRTRTDAGGDPVAVAERVFNVLPLGEDVYYRGQAEVQFRLICRLLHGMVDNAGNGYVFTMRDIAICLKGWGDTGVYAQALQFCLANSVDREAAREAENQVTRLGKDAQKTFTGIIGAVDKFLSPLVNAYNPDINFDEVLETNGLVYVQLPSNLFPLQAPSIGRVVLEDVQQQGSLRQVFRTVRNQTPFAVHVDEAATFVHPGIVSSLNKLRDANIWYLLAHQSPGDLEALSAEFATLFQDNTLTKVVLYQNNSKFCEEIAKGVGTTQVVERTVRRQQGPLFTSLTTGDASTKLVEGFRLHPNAIKSLRRTGQGYFCFGGEVSPVCFSMLPKLALNYPLPRRDQTKAPGLRLEDRFFVSIASNLPKP